MPTVPMYETTTLFSVPNLSRNDDGAHPGSEFGCVCTIGDYDDLVGIDSPRHQHVAGRMGDRNDEIRVPVEKALHTPDKIDHPSFLHGANGDNRVWPEIAHFEHERPAVNAARNPSRDSGKYVWRRRNNDVRSSNKRRCKARRQHKTQVVENSQNCATIGKHQRRDA